MTDKKLLSIGEVAQSLGRVPHTVRVWEYSGRLPAHLMPTRDERGWRWWTEEQLEGIRQWIIDEDIRPGKGLRAASKRIQGSVNEPQDHNTP